MRTPKGIRKAFEVRLKAAIDALPPTEQAPIAWPNIAFDDSAVDHYLLPQMHTNRHTPRTLGPAPRVSTTGIYSVQVRSKPGTGPDVLDDLAEIVKSAYPYSSDLDVEGVKIQIDEVSVGDQLPVNGWMTRAVSINWSIGI